MSYINIKFDFNNKSAVSLAATIAEQCSTERDVGVVLSALALVPCYVIDRSCGEDDEKCMIYERFIRNLARVMHSVEKKNRGE